MSHDGHTSLRERRALDSGLWRTFYTSPRLNQIQDALISCGVANTAELDRLVRHVELIAKRRPERPRLFSVGRYWFIASAKGFLRIKKGRKRPTLREIESRYGLSTVHRLGDRRAVRRPLGH